MGIFKKIGEMIAEDEYRGVCSKCGTVDMNKRFFRKGTSPTYAPPTMYGRCPASSDGKHKPRWKKMT